MDRRKVLLLVAAIVAALGTAVVFIYVRGADNRADLKFSAQQVLVANEAINPGETVKAAKDEGKFALKSVSSSSLVPGYVTDLSSIGGGDVALTTIYPGEQILKTKWGASAQAASSLTIPKSEIAISVNLSDPDRVAGFVNPGNKVAIFVTDTKSTRVLLSDVTVIGVGTTTVTTTTTTDPTSGAQTTEQLPRTLLTLALDQVDSQKVIFASHNSDLTLTFGLRSDTSQITKTAGTTSAGLFN